MSLILETVQYLEYLLSDLDKDVQTLPELQEIEAIIGISIPNEIKSLIKNIDLVSEQVDIFGGYDLESPQSLLRHYTDAFNEKGGWSFFAGNSIDKNFIATNDCGIYYYDEDSLPSHYKQHELIINLKPVIPIFTAPAGFSIVVNLGGKKHGELLIVSQDYSFGVLAPSLKDHFQDLIDGLKQGFYKPDADGYRSIEYPLDWGVRRLVMSGEYYIDEEDELTKS